MDFSGTAVLGEASAGAGVAIGDSGEKAEPAGRAAHAVRALNVRRPTMHVRQSVCDRTNIELPSHCKRTHPRYAACAPKLGPYP